MKSVTPGNSEIDVLLICALKDEYNQVLEVKDGILDHGWSESVSHDGWIVSNASFNTSFGAKLNICTTWSCHMGREQAQAVASKLMLNKPVQCIAMSGICGGRRGKVALGDVIFAERLWSLDAGKEIVENGEPKFQRDMHQYSPGPNWVQRMQNISFISKAPWLDMRPLFPLEYQENWVLLRMFEGLNPNNHADFNLICTDWGKVIQRLRKQGLIKDSNFYKPFISLFLNKDNRDFLLDLTRAGRKQAKELKLLHPLSLPEPPVFQIHVAPIATGAVVTEDENIFPRLAESMRKVLGLDMEASALGALGQHYAIPVLVAKGVSDFCHQFKDDRYRDFAARASAEYLIKLLRDTADLLHPKERLSTSLDEKITAELVSIHDKIDDQSPQEAIDRFIQSKLDIILKRRFFGESDTVQNLNELAIRIDEKDLSKASLSLRITLFRETAAAFSRDKDLTSAKMWLSRAKAYDQDGDYRCDDARLLITDQKTEEALLILRDYDNPEARALILDAIAKKDGIESAIEYAKKEELSGDKISGPGLYGLAAKAVSINKYELAEALLVTATDNQIEQCPAILSVRANVRVILCLPKSEHNTMEAPIPLHPMEGMLSDEPVKIELRKNALIDASEFLLRYAPQLNIPNYTEFIEDLILWLRLSHPENKIYLEAKNWLENEVQDVTKAVRWARFAFDCNIELNKQAITEYLEVRKRMGGWVFHEIIAALLIALQVKNHEQLLTLIRQERSVLTKVFEPLMLSKIEVEVLARTGDIAGAKKLIDLLTTEYDTQTTSQLHNLVKEISGGDALALRLAAFEETGGDNERRILVEELLAKKLYSEAGKHLTILFDKLPTIKEALRIANCHYQTADYTSLVAFLKRDDAHSLIPQSDDLQSYQAWAAYFTGDVNEALRILLPLRKRRSNDDDRRLEINLYVDSGNWEELHRLILDDLQNKEQRTSHDLFNDAEIGRVTGLAKVQIEELIDAIANKALLDDDPHMLLSAYGLIFSLGLEEKKIEAHEWFQQSVKLSGSDGPVQVHTMRDVIDMGADWKKRNDLINDKVTMAEAPLAIAASALNGTLINIIAGNFVTNTNYDDPRNKVALPLYAGNRIFNPLKNIKSIALDRSALMVFGFLGILDKVFSVFEEIVIARNTMGDFLQELTKVPFHQPTRVVTAKHIVAHIAASRLDVLVDWQIDESKCPNDVNESLQRLICTAQKNDGVVITSPPIYKVASYMEEEVDASNFSNCICGLQELVDFLVKEGEVGEEESSSLRKGLMDNGKRWDNFAQLERNNILYLDDLSLERLERIGMINKLSQVFEQLVVNTDTRDDAMALIEYTERQQVVEEIIHSIRKQITQAIEKDKVRISPLTHSKNKKDQLESEDQSVLSLSQLLRDVGEAEIAVIDDRALNKLDSILFEDGNRKPLVTSIDILMSLKSDEIISQEFYYQAMYKMRKAGALFIPMNRDELVLAALKSKSINTSSFELNAIADYLDFVRIRGVLQLPHEMGWLGQSCLEVLWAMRIIWTTEQPIEVVEASCQKLLDILPDPYDWIEAEADDSLLSWARQHYIIRITFLADGMYIQEQDRRNLYLDWVERVIIGPMVKADPSILEDTKYNTLQLLSQATKDISDELKSTH